MSIIVYTCPKCGEELEEEVLASYPPIYVTRCRSCGWKTEKQDDILKIPYPTSLNQEIAITTYTDYTPNPCKSCSKHPRNGGDGICHCVLGNPTIY